MQTVLITGSGGLVGSETALYFGARGFRVIGVDNNLREYFFGPEASTTWVVAELQQALQDSFVPITSDIRDFDAVRQVFEKAGDVDLVVHTAAQPSHDWAAKEPFTDFGINAQGTLNMLEATRQCAPEATFIFTSTNKVYGDTPNRLPLEEQASRWECVAGPYADKGIDETMSIDQTTHSLFGASKVAADIMVQEYGRYFGLKTGVFRGGCLTGPRHSGAELHGFLAYLMKCAATGREYRIFGYKGKQVRDNIHSADLVASFEAFHQAPRPGEVYNMGGSRFSHCSMMEAVALCEDITGKKMKTTYVETNRVGDHIWWVSDISKFQAHYPEWKLTKNVRDILEEILDYNLPRWKQER
ncbi:MAG: NAD-dependent epimerase/dehydratase family protein [Kiritimatiellae bacterium]|nr:NAD-dependent epimerase/dehydratase family protein [Kiritimatiellia bacterium]MDD4341971.1 NAD-dependent epimerase/dehydratase family protein [Kiritimatiellia bacterium]